MSSGPRRQSKPPEAKRRRAVFVTFTAFWKSGLAEPLVSQARVCKHPLHRSQPCAALAIGGRDGAKLLM